MKKRKIIISIAGVLILALALFASFRMNKEEDGQATISDAVKTAVNVKEVQYKPITSYISLTGRVIPQDKVEIYAEVSGVSSYGSKPFKTGVAFNQGQTLIQIDDDEFRRSIVARKSQFMSLLSQVIPDLKIDFPDIYPDWNAYLTEFDIHDPLKPLPDTKTEQQRLFLAGREVYSSFYSLKEAEARLAKYNIVAPFNGVLTDALIDRGTLVRVGQRLGEFIKTGVYELEASVSYPDVEYLQVGDKVEMKSVNANQTYEANITRINDKVDPGTQMVKVYLQLKNENLKSGMYLEGKFTKSSYEKAILIPVEALVDDGHVYVVVDGKARLREIDLLEKNLNEAIISGPETGAIMIVDDRTKAFEGTEVTAVNN